jgi:5-methylcytosine-specific restriction endonuclease McrA
VKKCSKCGAEKELGEFKKDARRPDGRGSWCKSCEHKASAQWHALHPEKAPAYDKKYRATHLEQRQEQQREVARKYRQKHPEKVKIALKRWIAEHRDYKHAEKRNRRAQKRTNGGVVTAKEWQSILDKYNHKCLACGKSDVKLTMDHVIPIKLGGPNTIDNIQPLCSTCNSRKGSKHIDYRKKR